MLAVLSAQMIKVQIDPRNQGTRVVYDNAVILLRSSEKTTFVWATIGQAINGPSASSMNDLAVGETITFSFEPRSEDPADHSFLSKTFASRVRFPRRLRIGRVAELSTRPLP